VRSGFYGEQAKAELSAPPSARSAGVIVSG